MKNILLLIVFSIVLVHGKCQSKQIINQQLYWIRFYNQLALSNRWSWHNEFEERRFFVNNRHHHFIFHTRLHYKIAKNADIGAGFCYSLQDPQDPEATTILTVPELRGVQELNYNHAVFNRLSMSQRFRIDERFIHKNDGKNLIEGYDFNFRFRYRVQATYQIYKGENDKTAFIKISNELMVNAGKNIIYNRFDQNRIYAGFEKSFNRNFSAELGYLYWFQQKSNGFQYYDRDIMRLTLYHKIKL